MINQSNKTLNINIIPKQAVLIAIYLHLRIPNKIIKHLH